MALTLMEAAKLRTGETLRSAIIETFARSSDILAALPFETISGNALRYNQEAALPGIGFRGVNEAYSEGVGVINPITEPLVIAGGDMDVDKFIIDTMGADQRAVHEAMKIKAVAQQWHLKFIKGDFQSNPKEFDGLQVRLTGSQIFTQAAGALTLAGMDETIDKVDDPTHIICNKAMARRFAAAGRDQSVGGNIDFTLNNFGDRVMSYNGLPFLIADSNAIASTYASLDFSEPSTTTSVYVVSFREGMLVGIQNGDIDARDLGEQDAKPVWRTRVEWFNGIALLHPRAAARHSNITDVAITN